MDVRRNFDVRPILLFFQVTASLENRYGMGDLQQHPAQVVYDFCRAG